MRRVLTFFLLFSLAAGCLAPARPGTTSPTTMGPPSTCAAGVCLADPDSPEAKWILDTYGFHQITKTNHRFAVIQYEGNLVSLDSSIPTQDGDPNGQIAVYDFSTNRLYDAGKNYTRHFVRPNLSNGRVLFGSESNAGFELGLWNIKNDTTFFFNPGIGGRLGVYGFEGSWATFLALGAGNNTGVWAVNVDTRELFPLHLVKREDVLKPDGLVVTRDTAYTILDGIENGIAKCVFYVTDLNTKIQRVILRQEGWACLRPSAQYPYLTWETSDYRNPPLHSEVWFMDLRTNQTARAFQSPELNNTSFPALGNGWVIASVRPLGKGGGNTVAYHIPTGKQWTFLDEGDQKTVLNDVMFATNGKRMVQNIGLQPNEFHPDSFDTHLYWKNFPIPGTG